MGEKIKYKRRTTLKNFINGLISGALTIALVLSFCAPVKAATGRIDFIDVSHYQSESGLPISVFQTAKAGHIDGVVVKVSEGTNKRDVAAAVNIANARAAGLRVSAYHFGRLASISEAKQEAQWFDKNLQADGFNKNKDGYVVLDIEDTGLTNNKATLTEYANAFIAEMHRLGYDRTDIYSGSHYYGTRLIPSNLDNSQPWLARYATDGKTVLDPGYNRGAHQWSSTQKLYPGFGYFDVNIDYAGKYTGAVSSKVGKIGNVSLVNYLKSKGKAWSYLAREKLAKQYGIAGYKGTAAQNIALLAKLKFGVKPAPAKVVKQVTKAKTPVEKSVTSAYAVKRGDTLSGIGKAHGISYRTIMSLNGLHSTVIYPGQLLRLTKTASKPSAKSSTHIYTVRSGESLWAISRTHKTTVSHLKSINHLHSDLIHPGQKLKY